MLRFRAGTEKPNAIGELRHVVRLFPPLYFAKTIRYRGRSVTSDEDKGDLVPHQFVRDWPCKLVAELHINYRHVEVIARDLILRFTQVSNGADYLRAARVQFILEVVRQKVFVLNEEN